MVLRMSRPSKRSGSSVHQFRQRVPADVLAISRGRSISVELPGERGAPPIHVRATVGAVVKFSLQTREPDLAKMRHASASAQIGRQFQAWRSGAQDVSQRQLVALAGEVYRLYTDRFGENPRTPAEWAAFKALNRAASEGRQIDLPPIEPGRGTEVAQAVELLGPDLTAGIDALPISPSNLEGLEKRFGGLADWVLRRHGIEIDHETRAKLLDHVSRGATFAAWQLKRNADGDYTPDPNAARFPPVRLIADAISLDALYEKWEAETKPSASTQTTWRGTIRSLKDQLGAKAADITKITADDIVAWKDAAVARGLAPKTINSSYLGSANAIFNYATRNKLLETNPADGVRVLARRQAGRSRLPYSDAEVTRLLELSKAETDPARRWLPWLAAASGARIGELVQLWGKRVTNVDGHNVLVIAPAEDGGSLKNEGSERTIPLHPVLIEAGFLDFVRSKGDGPLFYRRSSGKASKRHASKGVSNRLAQWIREAGFDDLRKAPNHAFRHWFKSAAARGGMSDSMADAIQGHAGKTTASAYRHFEVRTMGDAIASLPLPPKAR